MKNNALNPLKVKTSIIEVNLNFRERPIASSIFVCFYKPDMAFIILMYMAIYVFLFYLILMKTYSTVTTIYYSLSPTTHEKIHYFYTNIIDFSIYVYNINWYFIDMALHKIQIY